MTHFATRCRERGITSIDGKDLELRLRNAIRDQDEAVAQFVKRVDDECSLYRFNVEEGMFYCIAGADHWPRTVYTQEMKRKLDKAKKSERYRASRAGSRTFLRFRDDRRGMA